MFQNNHNQPAGLSQFDLYVHEKESQTARMTTTRRFEVAQPQPVAEKAESRNWLASVIRALFAHKQIASQH